jgi:hypothetical protein
MFELTTVKVLGILWGAITVCLAAAYIYRGIVAQGEDDQLFLDKAEDHIRREQEQIVAKIVKLDKVVLWLGVASGVMLVVWGGVWVYIGLTTT